MSDKNKEPEQLNSNEPIMTKLTTENENIILHNTEFEVSSYSSECEDYNQINKILAMKKTTGKLVIFILANIFTVGIINLFVAWFPNLKLYLIYTICVLEEAEYIGIYGKDNKLVDKKLQRYSLNKIDIDSNKNIIKNFNLNLPINGQIIMFEFKLFDYIFNKKTGKFEGLTYRIKIPQDKFQENFTVGLNSEEIEYQKKIHGICDIDIKINSIWKVLFEEITDPFYLFQVYSCILWYCSQYEIYASVIIVLTIISLIICVYDTYTNLKQIQSMARYSCDVNIFRKNDNNEIETKYDSSTQLVPGDLFEIPEDGLALPCDCILVSGSVIINESMLTGESTPVVKNHMPSVNVDFDSIDEDCQKYVLFGGTKVVQKRALSGRKVLAVVYQTGFKTVKGNLIRKILFPKEEDESFTRDSVKYIIFMCIMCIVGFGISVYFIKVNDACSDEEIVTRFFDIITTAVPPSLPTCLSVGITYALTRLKKVNIFCIHRDKVNMAGSVNMIVFDKTGTLTEDHLDISGYLPVNFDKDKKVKWEKFMEHSNLYNKEVIEHFKKKSNDRNYHNKKLDYRELFIECLASCHCLTNVKGKNIGDPIDIKMFEEVGWIMKENVDSGTEGEKQEQYDPLILAYLRPNIEDNMTNRSKDINTSFSSIYELALLRRFDFSSKLQRMTTITKSINESFFKAFCKGSPEKVRSLCNPETVPKNFDKVLEEYTSKGFRVLGMAAKMINMNFKVSQVVNRETVEKNMIFLGLLIVKNKLKTATKHSITSLDNADIRMVMATGDNILTATCVARECNIIQNSQPLFACEIDDGNLVWKKLDNEEGENKSSNGVNKNDTNINHAQHMLVHNMDGNKESLESREEEMILKENESTGDNNTTEEMDSLINVYPAENFDNINFDVKKQIKDDEDEKEIKTLAKRKSSLLSLHLSVSGRIEIDDKGKTPKDQCGSDFYCIAIAGDVFERLYLLNEKYRNNKDIRLYKAHCAFRNVLKNGRVFARMSPENKAMLVQSLKNEGLVTLMCGDGANDCAALRQANVGVSLSPEEASIAAHFNSQVADISCLENLLREGKCSLVTCIQTFKYMMLYSIIQFICVTLMLIYLTYLTDFQFLISDLFIIFPLAWFISMTAPADKLTFHYPISNILSFPIISSITLQTVLIFIFQLVGYKLLKTHFNWENLCDFDEEEAPLPCHENTVIFLISHFQYLSSALALSSSRPFREPIYKNWLLILYLVAIYFYSIWFTINCDDWSKNLIGLFDFEKDSWDYEDEEEESEGEGERNNLRLLSKIVKKTLRKLFKFKTAKIFRRNEENGEGNDETDEEESNIVHVEKPSDVDMIKYWIFINLFQSSFVK